MEFVLAQIQAILAATWHMLQDASFYIIIGLLAGGLLKAFLSPAYVASHLGKGRFRPVFKAALLGIPLPLCSCGVLPAAAELKRQGANNGATTAFLISTPESGVDSISISWALLDPLMTLFRPLAAFVTALVAGISENLFNPPRPNTITDTEDGSDCSCNDSCCQESGAAGSDTLTAGFRKKIWRGIVYACRDLWGDLAVPFFIGLALAACIGEFIPDTVFQSYLSGGWSSMLVMLLMGIPLYICATTSTPLAAAFILKGVSPGAVLVFLLAGPATNITSITVLARILGKRALTLYLVSIAVVSVGFGLALDLLYAHLDISARAVVGQAADITPPWLMTASSILVLFLSIKPISQSIAGCFTSRRRSAKDCSCTSGPEENIGNSAQHDTSQAECHCGCACSVPVSEMNIRK